MIEDCLTSPLKRLSGVHFAVTNRCNLRCLYCPRHGHDMSSRNMSAQLVSSVISFCIRNDIKNVGIGYFGETMLFDGWDMLVDIFHDNDISVDICSNFNHTLSDKEISTLSMVKSIQFSIDSFARDVMARLRPPADIRMILYNLHRIRAAAIMNGNSAPSFVWNCVLSNLSIKTLKQLIASAASCGVSNVCMSSLTRFSGCTMDVKGIHETTDAEYFIIYELLADALSLARKLSVNVLLSHEKFVHSLSAKYKNMKAQYGGLDLDLIPNDFRKSAQFNFLPGLGSHYYDATYNSIGSNFTRNCLSPWERVFVSESGQVYPCCVDGKSLGVVSRECTLEDILHGSAYKTLRYKLLSGDLRGTACFECPIAPPVRVDEYQDNFRQLIRNGALSQVKIKSQHN